MLGKFRRGKLRHPCECQSLHCLTHTLHCQSPQISLGANFATFPKEEIFPQNYPPSPRVPLPNCVYSSVACYRAPAASLPAEGGLWSFVGHGRASVGCAASACPRTAMTHSARTHIQRKNNNKKLEAPASKPTPSLSPQPTRARTSHAKTRHPPEKHRPAASVRGRTGMSARARGGGRSRGRVAAPATTGHRNFRPPSFGVAEDADHCIVSSRHQPPSHVVCNLRV